MRAKNWTITRRLMDYLVGREEPGKHHPIWTTPLEEL